MMQGRALQRWAVDKPVDLQDVKAAIADGFGNVDVGEDQFDAVVGLLGMLAVILGYRTDGRPTDISVLNVEGWILGQQGQLLSG